MNKIFKVVFNKSTGNMEVRSEIDNNQGKTSESRKSNKLTAISLSLMLAAPTVSYAANDTSELTNTSAVYQFLNEI